MQFEELLHWNDGQFLQPHHFQYFQRQNMALIQNIKQLALPYPWGLIEFKIDEDSLAAGRVVVKQFAAVLRDGTALSMPGNCLLSPFNLTETLKKNPNEITIYLALSHWSEIEANLGEEGSSESRRLYSTEKRRRRDENTGDNEIALITRRFNARLTSDPENEKNSQLLPVLKLEVLSHDKTERAMKINEKYFPPYIKLTQSNPLFGVLLALIADIRRCKAKAQDILTTKNFKNEDMAGYEAYTVLRLKTLNLYDQRISSLLASGNVNPFDIYMELTSLLCELMAYDPINSVREISRYNHEDSAPAFTEIIKDIRSFILKEGSADFYCLQFKPIDDGKYLYTPITPEQIFKTENAYLALKSAGNKDEIIKSLEEGDTFKLINPQSKQLRIRGIKLTEEPYPPRYLPVITNTIWFKLDLNESSRVWREITDEGGMAVDFVANIFPQLELSLYLTIGGK